MSACAYRSLEPVLQLRLAALQERRVTDAPMVDLARRVASRRMARACGGCVALGVAVAAFVTGLASMASGYEMEKTAHMWATALLLGAWAAGVGVTVLLRLVTYPVLAARLDAPFALSGNVAADLASLDARDPVQSSVAVAVRWERASVALPLAAVSMLAPLTIHCVVWCGMSASTLSWTTLRDYGGWIAMSALLVSHAHLAVLVGAVRWAWSLRSRPTAELRSNLLRHWGLTLLVAVGAACLPGVVLLGIPPILVAVTGLLFVPAMFAVAARSVQQERLALEAAR